MSENTIRSYLLFIKVIITIGVVVAFYLWLQPPDLENYTALGTCTDGIQTYVNYDWSQEWRFPCDK